MACEVVCCEEPGLIRDANLKLFQISYINYYQNIKETNVNLLLKKLINKGSYNRQNERETPKLNYNY